MKFPCFVKFNFCTNKQMPSYSMGLLVTLLKSQVVIYLETSKLNRVLTSGRDFFDGYELQIINIYRPRSEVREGYVFTGICLFNFGGGGGDTECIMG